jgi:DNA-binding NarL/FixJ family response regulator
MRIRHDATTKSAENASLSFSGERHTLNLDGELWTRLRRTAQARDQPLEGLAADLLARGLDQEAQRVRAEASLESLTPREQQVALLTRRGLTNRQIATVLVISPETVKTHVRHTLEKFGLHSKAELRLLLLELGSIQRHSHWM